MKTVEAGNNVVLHYIETIDDGIEYENTHHASPLNISIGKGQILKNVEEALLGMTVGETKKVELTPEQAFGERRDNSLSKFPRNIFPNNGNSLKLNETIVGRRSPEGPPILATVNSFTDEEIILDMNHPLAGKNVSYELEIIQIAEDTTTFQRSLDEYTVKELRGFAKEKGIKGFSTMKKAELVESLSS